MSKRKSRQRSGVAVITLHDVTVITQWSDLAHVGCQVCTPVVLARADQHRENLRQIHSASLHRSGPLDGQAPSEKQETPSPARPEVSTPAQSNAVDGRAASAQSATSARR